MPTLFISYKRGTSAVAPLMEHLKSAHYRLWFDRNDIHLGDTDWQARIDRGIESCDALILCLSPAACESEPVQYEITQARKLNKPIFPLVLEKLDDWSTSLEQVGLTPEWHTEDFTDVTQWNAQIERLLRDLAVQGFPITHHSKRELRGSKEHTLHQRYLQKLVSRIGMLSLANISPDASGMVQLEDVYIDSPTELSLSLEVQDWHIVDWWIEGSTSNALTDKYGTILTDNSGEMLTDSTKVKPEDLGYDRATLEALIGDIDAEIAAYREANPELKADEEYSWHNDWNNGTKRNYLRLHIQDIAASSQKLVVLGQPGSGKSTFVKHLALCLAGEQLDGWSREAKIEQLNHWVHGALTPIYIELRHFVVSKHFPSNIHTQPTVDNLWAYIQHEILGSELVDYLDDLKQDIEQGHAAIILDGLDEVPYPEGQLRQRQQQISSLGNLLSNPRFAKSRVLVASRPYAYENWLLPDFTAITITDFTDSHRIALAKNLYQASGLDAEAAQEKAEALNEQLSNIDPQLKDRPLFLTLMATVYLRGDSEGLPTRRGALYRESILLLLDRWTQSKAESLSLVELLGDKSLDDLYKRLAALAYDVHSKFGEEQGTPEIDEMLLYKHLKPLGRTTAAELIPYLSENAGVLVSPGQDEEHDVFHFAHRTFQEYLAAAHIASLCLEDDTYALVRDLIISKEQVWRIPGALVGDVLADTGRKSEIWDLIGDLLETELPTETTSLEWWAAWLAGTISLEQELYLQENLRRTEKTVRDALVEWSLALIKQEALPPKERALAGRVLGYFKGDTRKGIGLDGNGVPEIEWCEVAAGEFLYGENKAKQSIDYDYAYAISKYPVTNVQFQAFIDAPDGYNNPQNWTKAGLEWKGDRTAPDESSDPNFRLPNHPRINVTWYEAYAFTQWLSNKLDYPVTLPTEQEWEKAARGTDGREYAWGNEWDENKCNNSVGNNSIGQSSAVGIFPSGDSPYGASDMTGNVWEWCLTEYNSGSNAVEDEDAKDKDKTYFRRVMRGGSWLNYGTGSFRASFRFRSYPDFGNGGRGFRLSRSYTAS